MLDFNGSRKLDPARATFSRMDWTDLRCERQFERASRNFAQLLTRANEPELKPRG
jgi:hypothetical protein